MENLRQTWDRLSGPRRAMLIGAVVATLALVFMIGRIATTPSMALLYSGLDQRAAGEVVAALEQLGAPTEVRGDAIYVPSDQRDRLRLDLAQQGLPAQGQAGYELLDNLSGFGTTSEMFRAAYWRAKEGELARTIRAAPGIVSARVHINAGERQAFSRGGPRATASVHVRSNGGGLSRETALSIRFLVALAVPNLQPSDVVVADADQGVILRPGTDQPIVVGAAEAERRAQALGLELERMLAVRVGDGNAHVSVTVETTKQTQTISERIIDPESQVPTTTESEQVVNNSRGAAQGVTVASNLPEGDAGGGQGSESNSQETRETTAFRYSETQRDQRIEAGAIKRLGVAVLVNEAAVVAPDGTVTYQPRPPEELAAIEELVKSAIAYDAERGDVVTVESMRFAIAPEAGTVAEQSWIDQLMREQGATLAQMLVLGVVALLIGLFVLRPILSQQARDEEAAAEIDALAAPDAVAGEALDGDAAAAGRIAGGDPLSELGADAGPAAISGPIGAPGAAVGAPGVLAGADASEGYAALAAMADEVEEGGKPMLERLEEAATTRTPEVVALLRHWLKGADEGEPA